MAAELALPAIRFRLSPQASRTICACWLSSSQSSFIINSILLTSRTVRIGSASVLGTPSFTSSGPRAWTSTLLGPPLIIKPPIIRSSTVPTKARVEILTILPLAAEVKCETPSSPASRSNIAAAPRTGMIKLPRIERHCSTLDNTGSKNQKQRANVNLNALSAVDPLPDS